MTLNFTFLMIKTYFDRNPILSTTSSYLNTKEQITFICSKKVLDKEVIWVSMKGFIPTYEAMSLKKKKDYRLFCHLKFVFYFQTWVHTEFPFLVFLFTQTHLFCNKLFHVNIPKNSSKICPETFGKLLQRNSLFDSYELQSSFHWWCFSVSRC